MRESDRYNEREGGRDADWEGASGVPTPAGLYDKGESMWKLSVRDHRTLDRWVAAAGMQYQDDPTDAKRRLLTEAQLRQLARRKGRTLRDGEPPERTTREAERARIPTRLAALEAEVRLLREQLDARTARLDTLDAGHGAILAELAEAKAERATVMTQLARMVAFLALPASERDRGMDLEAGEGEGAPVARRAPRQTVPLPYTLSDYGELQNRPSARPSATVGLPPLPAGWTSYFLWCERQGVDHRTMDKWIAKSLLPQPTPGAWRPPSGRGRAVKLAYSPQQQEDARAALQRLGVLREEPSE